MPESLAAALDNVQALVAQGVFPDHEPELGREARQESALGLWLRGSEDSAARSRERRRLVACRVPVSSSLGLFGEGGWRTSGWGMDSLGTVQLGDSLWYRWANTSSHEKTPCFRAIGVIYAGFWRDLHKVARTSQFTPDRGRRSP